MKSKRCVAREDIDIGGRGRTAVGQFRSFLEYMLRLDSFPVKRARAPGGVRRLPSYAFVSFSLSCRLPYSPPSRAEPSGALESVATAAAAAACDERMENDEVGF